MYNRSGLKSEIDAAMTVTQVDVAKQGVTAVSLEDGNTNYINMCRTQVRIRMNTPAEYFLKNPLGNHHIMLHGNYEDTLNEFFQANACKRTE